MPNRPHQSKVPKKDTPQRPTFQFREHSIELLSADPMYENLNHRSFHKSIRRLISHYANSGKSI